MPTQLTPFALVYGVEVVLQLELQISSLRICHTGRFGKRQKSQASLSWAAGPW